MIKKKTIKTEIISNKKTAKDHYVMAVGTAYLAKNSRPGQFVNVKVREEGTDPLLRIPLGVHAIEKKGIKLLYKVVGQATEILSKKRTGEALDILGPLGNGFDLAPAKRKEKIIVVAGGHGAAPLYALTEAIIKKRGEVEFFTGACTGEHIVCVKELRKIGAKVHVATEDGSKGKKGYVTDILREFLRKAKGEKGPEIIYSCGPRPMLREVAKCAKESNIPAQVSLDAYMACGIGACLGCAIETVSGYKLVCKDGPVFSAEEIRWGKI